MSKSLQAASTEPTVIRNIKKKLLQVSSGKMEEITIDLKSAKKPFEQGVCKAGLAETDITPPPGVPKGGYSAMSKTGTGFRSRLKARVFYISPQEGQSLCILQADLHAGSAIIRNKVAELVAEHTDINPANICLTCTHTHSGPGQLLESNFYNKFASHKPGFDLALFNHISQRIAQAVIAAYQNARPAKISSGVIHVEGVTRNRSLTPYLNNKNIQVDRADPALKYKAINPKLHLVRVDLLADDGNYYPAGAFSNFSIHGTCIPATSELYSADSWGYVARGLERWISEQYQPPWNVIHGPSQGTHGDIAPDVKDKNIGFPEARRIGGAIAEKAQELFRSLDGQGRDDINVRNGLRMVDFYRQPEINGIKIASRPVVGTALTAGAYEHSTPILYHVPFFKHGMGSARFFFPDSEQGHKRKLGGAIQHWVLPKPEFPHEILFQAIQLGDFVLVGVPFEVSVAAGKQIEGAVQSVLNVPQAKVCIASLTNGYTGYTTTAEEYEKQYYEGGHTLYGPNSNSFIAEHCRNLMADVINRGFVSDIPQEWCYQMHCGHYFHKPASSDTTPHFSQVGNIGIASTEYGEPYIEARFKGPSADQLDWHNTLVTVEQRAGNSWQPAVDSRGQPLTDQNADIEIRYAKGMYQVRWYYKDDLKNEISPEKLRLNWFFK